MLALKISLSDAALLKDQLHNLSAHTLPGNIKFKIYQTLDELERVVKPYTKTRDDLIKQYGEPLNGNYIIRAFTGERGDIPNPKKEEWDKAIAEIDVSVDITANELPEDLFSEKRDLSGDFYMVYTHMLKKERID